MSRAYCRLHFHLVFGTKGRLRTIESSIKEQLHCYMIGIIRNLGGGVEAIGGTDDHVHVLFFAPPKFALSEIIATLKASSSKWMHETHSRIHDFAWQRGYGLFTVSESSVEPVKAYIGHQEEHHRRMTFEEEYIAMLQKHGIEYEPRYVFD
jgi:putative transposase